MKEIKEFGEIHKEWTAAGRQSLKGPRIHMYPGHGLQLLQYLCQALEPETGKDISRVWKEERRDLESKLLL